MKIGIISDTHGFFDPRLKRVFTDVQAILHAGDVGTREVLEELREIAPVHVVRGNVDPAALNLPPSLTLVFGRMQVELVHMLPIAQSELEAWSGAIPNQRPPQRRERFLQTFNPSTRVVVFGHSHKPCLATLGDALFFNPGSAGKKRFSLPRCCGLLEIGEGRICASIRGLESYNRSLPKEFRWTQE